MSKKLVDFEVLTISPSVAKEMLKTNINNRPPIKSSINHYSRQMSGGKWRMTGEAIKFDEDGNSTLDPKLIETYLKVQAQIMVIYGNHKHLFGA